MKVIARENKGPGIGIEYAYSRAATSVANPSPSQVEGLRKSIWVAGDTGAGQAVPQQQYRPPTTTTPPDAPKTMSVQQPKSAKVVSVLRRNQSVPATQTAPVARPVTPLPENAVAPRAVALPMSAKSATSKRNASPA